MGADLPHRGRGERQGVVGLEAVVAPRVGAGSRRDEGAAPTRGTWAIEHGEEESEGGSEWMRTQSNHSRLLSCLSCLLTVSLDGPTRTRIYARAAIYTSAAASRANAQTTSWMALPAVSKSVGPNDPHIARPTGHRKREKNQCVKWCRG